MTNTEWHKQWRSRLAASKRRRDDRIALWQENVNARRGSVSGVPETYGRAPQAGDERIVVNQDWALTKAKIAQLYSQTPEVRLSPKLEPFQKAVYWFSRELNDAITDASVGSTIEEVLSDVINAAGIGGVLVSCEQRTEPRDIPLIDPSMLPPDQQMALATGAFQIPTQTVDVPVDIQHVVRRISPADLLIPADFTGSNYDHARWLGHDGRMTWEQAVVELGLTEDQKDRVVGADTRASGTMNTLNTDSTAFRDTDVVTYQEVFYWRHFYHADETSFSALQRLVFVSGLDEPVINEPYRAQQRGQNGEILGVVRNPIRILTLTYISDDNLPPSDSTISRFQVNELESSRDQMMQQRRHSIPIRWFDANRVSQGTRSLLEKGTFQGFIPTNGPGDRAVGEVARAAFPGEKFDFDRVIKGDISEMWQVGSNQAGAFASGERSASEAKIVQQNFQNRVGQERDKVTRFFIGIAEVMAGHLALYGTTQAPDQIGVERETLATGFVYSVRSDSTVRMDAQQRIQTLREVLNLTAQSGYINPKPLISEIIELSGLDPNVVVIDPQPKGPDPVKVSVNQAADLMNPLFVALLMRTGQAPTPDDLAASKRLLEAAGMSTLPMLPLTPSGVPAEPATPDVSNPNWQMAPRIDRRAEDNGA